MLKMLMPTTTQQGLSMQVRATNKTWFCWFGKGPL